MSESCLTLTEITACQGNSLGGVTQLYFGKEADLTITIDESTGVISAIDSTPVPVAVDVRKDSVDFADPITNDFANGSTVYNATLNATIHTMTLATKLSIRNLAVGQPLLYVCVVAGDGKIWLLRNMRLATDGAVHGRTLADGANHTLVFNGQNSYFATNISQAQLTTLLTP